MTEAQTLRAYIAHKEQQIQDLLDRHGQGVRPDWVSEELSILYFYKADGEKQLAALEINDATD